MISRVATVMVAAVAATLAVAGCANGVATLSVPKPPPVSATAPSAPSVTLPAGLAGVQEPPVAGATTTTAPAMAPGPASLTGTVLGPGGPVGGATVQADRLVGNSVASTRVTTAADGSWSLHGVLGGRYRLRAWQQPDLDLVTPQIVFITAGPTQTFTLRLTAYPGPQVAAAVNPGTPIVGQPANLVVQVQNPSVDTNGHLGYSPVVGVPVALVDGPDWQVAGNGAVSTDGNGNATFEVACTTVGIDPLSAQVGSSPPVVLQMPPCSAPPATTTTTAPLYQYNPPPSSTTSTSCPPGVTTTTDPFETTTTLTFGSC